MLARQASYQMMAGQQEVVHLPETSFLESLAETLREVRLAQVAGIEQQRDAIRYIHDLHEWIRRDVQDRQSELHRVAALVEELKEAQASAGKRKEVKSKSQDSTSTSSNPDIYPQPWSAWGRKSQRSSSAESSRHPVFLTHTPSHTENKTVDPTPPARSRTTNASTTVTVTLGPGEGFSSPAVKVIVQAPSSQHQYYVLQPQPQYPRFQSTWHANNLNASQVPPSGNGWGMPPAHIPMPMPYSVPMQNPWYPQTAPNDIPMDVYQGTSLPIVPGMDGRFFNHHVPHFPQHMSSVFIPPIPRMHSPSSEQGRKSKPTHTYHHPRNYSPIDIYANREQDRHGATNKFNSGYGHYPVRINSYSAGIIPPFASQYSPVNSYGDYPFNRPVDSEMPVIVPATGPNSYVPHDLANRYPNVGSFSPSRATSPQIFIPDSPSLFQMTIEPGDGEG